ncbi:MAG TPA: NAD(P)-dependent alcohol dehydrogenase [Microlunatus sp.]|nr:NAD(P)-dependent alcohol dehydrogenase [Microlunatus sp.]
MQNPSAVLHGPRDLRIEDRPVPTPGPGEVLVEIAAVGICGSDVHYFEHGRIGSYVVAAPMIIGHESAGTIIAVGADVEPSRVGELVALEPGVPCGACFQCRRGTYNLCPRIEFFATPPIDGSISRFVTIAAAFAHPAPAGLSAEQAAMAEPVSVGIWAARKTGVGGGDRVLVTGAGPVGLLAAQVARALGAQVPVIIDTSPTRLDRARRLGLRAVPAGEPLQQEFDVLLECSGAAPALAAGMRALAPGGRVALIGMGSDTVSLDVPLVQGHELTVAGVFRYAHTYPFALQLISEGAVNVHDVITHRFAFEDTEAALTVGRVDPSALKAMVVPSAAHSQT